MTNPVLKNVKVTGYAGAQAGIVKTPDYKIERENRVTITNDSYLNSGAIIGCEANYKGTFARAEVGLGTAYSGKIEVGHSFDIRRNMGFELSANAQTGKSLLNKNDIGVKAQAIYSSDNTYLEASKSNKIDWKSGVSRLGAAAKFTFGSQKAKFGIGCESGIIKGSAPNGNLKATAEVYNNQQKVAGATNKVNINNKTKYYGTPTVSADIKLGKNLSFNANVDFYQGQASIRYNF
jgi:hypothetical protein